MSYLPGSQLYDVVATERAFSTLSISSSLFVLGSFLGSNLFRTPVNRLIFYAAPGNILVDAAIMAGRAPIHRGEDGPLCQWQAFFINWYRFIPACSGVTEDTSTFRLLPCRTPA